MIGKQKTRTSPKPRIEVAKVADLIKAEWNYKIAGLPETIERLKNSIMRDASAGVLAVRELDNGTKEVIDGNHRLVALHELGWEEVPIENFGRINKADAIVISYRRNAQWFENDIVTTAYLMKDEVLPHVTVDELDEILPLKALEIENMVALIEHDKGIPPSLDAVNGSDRELTIKVVLEDATDKARFRAMMQRDRNERGKTVSASDVILGMLRDAWDEYGIHVEDDKEEEE